MDSEDFRYRVADDGRIAITGLTLEETSELEALLRWQGVTTNVSRELRLLELYQKHHVAFISRLRIIDHSTVPRHARDINSGHSRRPGRAVKMSQPVQALRSAVAIGLVSVGMFTIYLIVANL